MLDIQIKPIILTHPERSRKMLRALAFVTLLLLSTGVNVQAAPSTLVRIKTPRGATISFILIKPDKPVATVILFAGGHGALGLTGASTMRWGAGNFLVRTREDFAAQGLMVAVIDAPSDQRGFLDWGSGQGSTANVRVDPTSRCL